MKPYGYEPGKKYPLVLYIHGGPHSAYGEGWFDEFQNLAGAGMCVLFTNPRGSSGYGARLHLRDARPLGRRGLRGPDEGGGHRRRRPDVDSTRMGVTGGSYGGFMTAWITTKTNRFKAARDRPHDQRLDVLVRRVRRAGAHRVRVLRQAVGQLRRCTTRSRRSAT